MALTFKRSSNLGCMRNQKVFMNSCLDIPHITYPSVLRHYCIVLAVALTLQHSNGSPNACMIPLAQGSATNGGPIIMKRVLHQSKLQGGRECVRQFPVVV